MINRVLIKGSLFDNIDFIQMFLLWRKHYQRFGIALQQFSLVNTAINQRTLSVVFKYQLSNPTDSLADIFGQPPQTPRSSPSKEMQRSTLCGSNILVYKRNTHWILLQSACLFRALLWQFKSSSQQEYLIKSQTQIAHRRPKGVLNTSQRRFCYQSGHSVVQT